MKLIAKIETIDNGLLVDYGDGHSKGYQLSETNHQLALMVNDILLQINEHQNWKLVKANEAAKLSK